MTHPYGTKASKITIILVPALLLLGGIAMGILKCNTPAPVRVKNEARLQRMKQAQQSEEINKILPAEIGCKLTELQNKENVQLSWTKTNASETNIFTMSPCKLRHFLRIW